MAKPLKPFVRGGYYPSSRWTPLVYPGGYTTANGNGAEPTPLIKTVKGAIAHVTDALAMPAIGLKCEINPLQAGTGDPSPTNICPIIGWTGCNVINCSLPEISWTLNKAINVSGTVIDSSSNGKYSSLIPYANTTVFDVLRANNASCRVHGYDANGNWVRQLAVLAVNASTTQGQHVINYTADESIKYIRVSIGNANLISLKYVGTTYSITFPSEAGTVYGGTLDVMNGTLMATEANIANYDGETLPGEWVSDRDVYSAGATPTTGAQVVYKLSNPIAYQLTPQQIELLAGVNNIWHDANGDTELTYYAE